MISSAACGDDGGGGPAAPAVSETALDFGATECGTTGAPLAFVISNDGGEPFGFTAELAGGASSPYVVTPDSGVVGANSQLTVLVFPRPIPAVASTAGYDDTLTITTDIDGGTPHEIALSQTARGAILEIADTTIDFAGARAVGSAPLTQTLTIENTGTESASITVVSSSEAFTLPAGPTTIAAGDSADVTVSYVPYSSGSIAAELRLEPTGPTCAAAPVVTASGTGTFAGTASEVLMVGPLAQRRVTSTVCVLLTSGHVACVGSNTANARGPGPGVATLFSTPNVVRTEDGAPLDDVVEIVGAQGHVCALRGDSSVYCWGNVGNDVWKNNPEGQGYAIETAASAAAIAANYGFMCAATNPGAVLTCTGTVPQRWADDIDTTTWTITGATAIALNGGGGYALQGDGTVMSFGTDTNGARGNGDGDNSPPSLVTGVTGATAIVASAKRDNRMGGGCALITGGTASCWGDGRHGMNADGTENNLTAAAQVQTAAATPLTGITAMTSGRSHRCAIATGGLHCWGRGSEGQLGRATAQNNVFAAPTDPAITDAISVSAAGRGTCVVRTNRAITCFGRTPFSDDEVQSDIAAFGP